MYKEKRRAGWRGRETESGLFTETHDLKTEPQLFCGFPLVCCVVCMSECMCALINLIWDHWRKRHSLVRVKHSPLIICFHPPCAIEFSQPTIQLHAEHSLLSEKTTVALLRKAAFKASTCFSSLKRGKSCSPRPASCSGTTVAQYSLRLIPQLPKSSPILHTAYAC